VNTRHEVLDWLGLSRGVIALRPVLMYYVIEIDSSLFLVGLFQRFSRDVFCLRDFHDVLRDVLNVNLSFLFIVG
jgi:hypothetical protein